MCDMMSETQWTHQADSSGHGAAGSQEVVHNHDVVASLDGIALIAMSTHTRGTEATYRQLEHIGAVLLDVLLLNGRARELWCISVR